MVCFVFAEKMAQPFYFNYQNLRVNLKMPGFKYTNEYLILAFKTENSYTCTLSVMTTDVSFIKCLCIPTITFVYIRRVFVFAM